MPSINTSYHLNSIETPKPSIHTHYVLNKDGSETENEANAKAGVIMRKFGRENPQIFEGKLNEKIIGNKIATASVPILP